MSDANAAAAPPTGRAARVEAVIFDIDGTLIDSVDLHAHAWQDALRDFGHDIGFERIRAQIGKGGDQLMPVFLPPDELAARGEALDAHRGEVFKARYLPQVRAFADVRALFERLRGDGVRIALASSANEDELDAYRAILGVDDLLEAQTSSDDAQRSKPYPDIFQAALRRLTGVAAGGAIVVGDTPYDALAAGKAGLRTVGVLSGGFAERVLRQAGCIAVYADPQDLLRRYDAFLHARADIDA